MPRVVIQPGQRYVKVLVTSSQASLVIGKGGETVTQLRQLTGCLLKLSNTSHRFPGTDRQVLLVGGTEDVLNAGIERVLRVLNPEDGQAQVFVAAVVASSGVSALIGRGGESIAQLRASTGCNLSIKHPPNPPCGEQVMEVTGDMGNVVNALMSATMRVAEHANDFEQLGHVDYAFAQNGMGGPMPDDYSAVRSHPMSRDVEPYPTQPLSSLQGQMPPTNLPPSVAGAHAAISFLIPKASIGAVLGKGGKILADIRNHTGCSASIATDVSENEDPTVTVRGPVAGVHRCQSLILERALMHASQPTTFL